MSFDEDKYIDEISWQILQALEEDARISYAELGRKIGLSAPAAAERVRKLEESGIITGYRLEFNREKLGLPLMAFISITTPTVQYARFLELVKDTPEILECYHVAGNASFIMKVLVKSTRHLERFLVKVSPFGATVTTIVLSESIAARSPLNAAE